MNSSGPNMLIKFTTDTTIVARGFQIKYYNTAYVPGKLPFSLGKGDKSSFSL